MTRIRLMLSGPKYGINPDFYEKSPLIKNNPSKGIQQY